MSQDATLIEKSKFLSTQVRDNAPYYQHSHIGSNYRMSNIVAGIGRGQMVVLPQRVEQRRVNNSYYRQELGDIDGLSFLTEPDSGFYFNYWLTIVLFDSTKLKMTPNDLRVALEEENIESRLLWKPMHLQPIFEKAPFYGDRVSEDLFNRGLCLPSVTSLALSDLSRVCETIRKHLC